MALKEKLLENKRLNEENQYKVAQQHSQATYELGYSDTLDQDVDYSILYQPFVKTYADIQLKLQNNTSDNPAADRKYVESIFNSVDVIKNALENILSNVEIWTPAVQKAGMMGGVDLLGTPQSRYRAMNVLSDDLKGIIQIHAVDNDINKLAYEIYDDLGFVEIIYLNKLNKLSKSQDMFISIPDVLKQNQNFKMTSSEIFEQKEFGGETPILTGGVTEGYRKKDKNGELEIKTEDMGNGESQDFYIIDKESIGNSLQFNTEMDKISLGVLESYEGFDQVIAFNNNILAEVTDHYLKPAKALKEKEEKRFQEDYKKWYLEKEIGDKFPLDESPTPQQEEQELEAVTSSPEINQEAAATLTQ
jgi:hypothetical protein